MFGTLEVHLVGESLDLFTLAQMTITEVKDGTYSYSHHKKTLFNFHIEGRSMIMNKGNFSCDGGEGDEIRKAVNEEIMNIDENDDGDGNDVSEDEWNN